MLEQLDWLTNDLPVVVTTTDRRPISVNTRMDWAYFAAKIQGARSAHNAGG